MMAGILQYFDFSQPSSSRKLSHKARNDAGIEAPRNSLEFPSDASLSYNIINDDIPYSCHVKHHPKTSSCPSGVTVKKLIDGEVSDETNGRYNRRASICQRPERRKPHPREHPQEELLQKFKREFEAWQASKVWENSGNFEERNDERARIGRIPSLEHFDKGKAVSLANFSRNTSKKSVETRNANRESRSSLYNDVDVAKGEKHCFTHSPIVEFEHEEDTSPMPTKIVILKPCPEISDGIEESSVCSPELIKSENNIQDFLEEVKNRLKLEIEGKIQDRKSRWVCNDASFSERSTDPKQIARTIANHIKETVTKDFDSTLLRSKSTRSYQSENRFNRQNLAEFAGTDTRKLLSERLKSALKNEMDSETRFVSHRRRATSLSFEEAARSRPAYEIAKKGKRIKNWEDNISLVESKTRSFRQDHQRPVAFDAEAVSPRNLVRSLSAPVSGTAFVKLLSEDQHVLTGAQVRRKHEASDHRNHPESRKVRKDAFDLKGKVSSLRQNFTLKGKFFGKKTRLTDETAVDGFLPMRSFATEPSVVENSTEVPPSPASVCSNSADEICRAGYPSPVSPLEAAFTEDISSSQANANISSESPGPTVVRERTDGERSEEVKIEVEACESTAKAFVRNILVIAGLYEAQPFDQVFSGWDISTKPIPKWVFEEVEETCGIEIRKVDDIAASLSSYDADVSHRMLFDLVNEALPTVLQAPLTCSRFKNWFLEFRRMPHGKRLLDELWRRIQKFGNPPKCVSNSLDSLVARDLSTTPWSRVMHEDVDVLGSEIESEILEELIDEIVWDVL
uniref:DUF4378 domain-containing protein n=1 Tax=Ananas comosus var. bracteatus TaxID=296719 RepID=A0A6V7PX08_ANACO|nr:unnamed protein product [Ananas comosus var. bracteatus]